MRPVSASFSFETATDSIPAPIEGDIKVLDPGLNEAIRRFYEECDIEMEDLEEALAAHSEADESADAVETAITDPDQQWRCYFGYRLYSTLKSELRSLAGPYKHSGTV